MYVFKNAAKNLLRNKGRNFLVFIILLIIIVTASIAIIINTTTEKIVDNYASRFDVTAVLKVDYMKLLSSADSAGMIAAPEITDEQYRAFANSSYVKDYNAYGEFAAYVTDLVAVKAKGNSNANSGIIVDSGDKEKMYYTANAMIYGYSDISLLTDFIEGNRKITEGKAFSEDNECIISSELAKLNNLTVGDNLTIQPTEKSANAKIKLKIVGIYIDATENSNASSAPDEATANRRNDILTTYNTLSQISYDYYGITYSYTLTGPEVVDAFTKEVKEKGLPEGYYVSATDGDYEKIVAPVKGLIKMANIFLVVVLFLGSVILILLSLLTIRERKYEIGILRAKGMKKGKVALQFLAENFMLIAISLVFGLGIGVAAAQPVSNLLMAEQIRIVKAQEEEQNTSMQNIFLAVNDDTSSFGETAQGEMITEIDVTLTSEAVADIVVIAFLLSIISSITALLFITKYEPMEILANRT